jgi:hypothetical protein
MIEFVQQNYYKNLSFIKIFLLYILFVTYALYNKIKIEIEAKFKSIK